MLSSEVSTMSNIQLVDAIKNDVLKENVFVTFCYDGPDLSPIEIRLNWLCGIGRYSLYRAKVRGEWIFPSMYILVLPRVHLEAALVALRSDYEGYSVTSFNIHFWSPALAEWVRSV